MKYYLFTLLILSIVGTVSMVIFGFVPAKYKKIDKVAGYVLVITTGVLFGLIIGTVPWFLWR